MTFNTTISICIERTRGPRLPLMLVPTTMGTGLEVTAVLVIVISPIPQA